MRQLITRVGAVIVLFGAAELLSSTLLLADTTVTTTSAAANIGITLLYGAGVVGILFVLSSISTLSLIATEEARKESGAR